ncbi:hypothetical protein FXO37_00838 [Capsicum annuum]|nr:hypothetical protein FXO37_00838 [Capsicum annuum]
MRTHIQLRVGIVGTCGVVLLIVADPVYVVVDVATDRATVGTNQTTSKAAMYSNRLYICFRCGKYFWRRCKLLHDGYVVLYMAEELSILPLLAYLVHANVKSARQIMMDGEEGRISPSLANTGNNTSDIIEPPSFSVKFDNPEDVFARDLSAERALALEKLKENLSYFSLTLRRAKKDQEEYYKKAAKKESGPR